MDANWKDIFFLNYEYEFFLKKKFCIKIEGKIKKSFKQKNEKQEFHTSDFIGLPHRGNHFDLFSIRRKGLDKSKRTN